MRPLGRIAWLWEIRCGVLTFPRVTARPLPGDDQSRGLAEIATLSVNRETTSGMTND